MMKILNEFEHELKMIPSSNNKYIGRHVKTNKDYISEKKKIFALIYYSTLKTKPKKPFKKSILQLFYNFPDKKRRDPDNYSGKMIIDALVKSGIIEDDSFKNVLLLIGASFGEVAEPSTIITVQEIDNFPKKIIFE